MEVEVQTKHIITLGTAAQSLLLLWLLMSFNFSLNHPSRQAWPEHGLKSSYPISAATARLLFKVTPLKKEKLEV